MLRDKLVAGSQQAAELYCAAHPQWAFIVPALVLGTVLGTMLGAVTSGLTVWSILLQRKRGPDA